MLNSGCANACALNGLPGPMRHWFTRFTHSLKWSINFFGNHWGGCACDVKIFVLSTFNCRPTAAKFSTNLSNNTPMTW